MSMGVWTRRSAIAGALALACLGLAATGCDSKDGVHKIEPNFGNVSGNDDVALIGKGFRPGLTVRFGTKAATHIVIESDSKVRLKTPAGPEGKVDVTIVDETGKSVSIPAAFTYRKATQ